MKEGQILKWCKRMVIWGVCMSGYECVWYGRGVWQQGGHGLALGIHAHGKIAGLNLEFDIYGKLVYHDTYLRADGIAYTYLGHYSHQTAP